MEIWKDIKGYEGLYQISNYGRVKSLKRIIKDKNNRSIPIKEKILKLNDNGLGYKFICLTDNNNKKKKFYIHRLVAIMFIPSEEGKDIINHLDCNPSNNYYKNLEWTTKKGNTEYMIKLNRNVRTKEWINKLRASAIKNYGKKVKRINIRTGKTKIYACLNDTKKDGFTTSSVSQCCNNIRNKHKGYKWEFVEE
jgi:hypothetical protein